MEDLFWTTLNLDGQPIEYHIIFEDEQYRFIPKDSSHAQYAYKREHDEWLGSDEASEKVKDSAVEALDMYLLRQH